jgi:hypothetical protein
MITKVMSSIAPKAIAQNAKPGAGQGSRLTKLLQSEALGKVLDVAADNQTRCQSLFALGICLGPRPIANFIVTEDKQDAVYASCHSISSGIVGYLWPLILVTPIANGVKKMAKNPAKYFKPELVQKFYPDVAIKEEMSKDGKTLVKKVVTNEKGQMLRKDGSVLLTEMSPLRIFEDKEKFLKEHPELTLDESGYARSKTVFETANGKVKLDKNGNKIGAKVREDDLRPITEEMELGAKKDQNVQKFVNMVSDIILAPARAALTIALIPPLLNAFGIKKGAKGAKQAQQQQQQLNVTSYANNIIAKESAASTFSAFKKGCV